jgi:hypothetical protein
VEDETGLRLLALIYVKGDLAGSYGPNQSYNDMQKMARSLPAKDGAKDEEQNVGEPIEVLGRDCLDHPYAGEICAHCYW